MQAENKTTSPTSVDPIVIRDIVETLKAESKRYHLEACEHHESGREKKQMMACIHYSEAINWAETKVRLIAESHGIEI